MGSVSVESVYTTLQASLGYDGAARSAAQSQLLEWEKNCAPGFMGSLLKIAIEVQNITEDLRLFAVVLAKNTIDHSWKRMNKDRDWSLIPEDEKHYIRTTVFQVLLQDPSSRVALQASLLIANISRYDFPHPWSNLLSDLAGASLIDSQIPIESKHRALHALKHTIQAMRLKRFTLLRGFGSPIRTAEELELLGHRMDIDREAMNKQLYQLFSLVRGQWESNFTSLLQRTSQGWDARGRLAADGAAVLREICSVIPRVQEIEEEFHALMIEGAQAMSAIIDLFIQKYNGIRVVNYCNDAIDKENSSNGMGSALTNEWIASDPFVRLLCKCWERVLQMGLHCLERHPTSFARHVPTWIGVCINKALLGMDSAMIHGLRAKSRVLLTQLVARALIQPAYIPQNDEWFADAGLEDATRLPWIDGRVLSQVDGGAAGQPQRSEDIQAAICALDGLVSQHDNRCTAIVQAIVSKYVALSRDEIEEWESDPEGFARQIDAETSPDADTPRPCGIVLLECMLERAGEATSQAIMKIATSVQQSKGMSTGVESVLAREALYRTVGECFPHLKSKVDFKAWYAGELRGILHSPPPPELQQQQQQQQQVTLGKNNIFLADSIIRARVLWLIGMCGEELETDAWNEAFAISVQHMTTNQDLVVALMSVSAITAMIATAIDQEKSLQPENRRLWLDNIMGNDLLPIDDQERALLESMQAQAAANFGSRLDTIDGMTDAIIHGCFSMLPRLMEAESMVRVLQCVSATVELLGDRVAPHLGTITGSLPHVWSVLSSRQTGAQGTGALVRLHCSLLAMLSHLISKLGRRASEDPQVSTVLLPLLIHATDVNSAESEPLMDDGLKLWLAVLQTTTSSALRQEMVDMLGSRLAPMLQRGQDNALAFRLVEAYALHLCFRRDDEQDQRGSGLMLSREAAQASSPSRELLLSQSTLAPITTLLPCIAAAVSSSLDAAYASMLQSPPPGNPHRTLVGNMTAETVQEALGAVSVLLTLQRVYEVVSTRDGIQYQHRDAAMTAPSSTMRTTLPPELELPVQKAVAMACREYGTASFPAQGGGIASPAREAIVPDRCIPVFESIIELFCRVVFRSPSLIPALVPRPDGQSSSTPALRFLERWISIISVKDIGEVFIPSLGAIGRVRRHNSAVAMCALIVAGAFSDELQQQVPRGGINGAMRVDMASLALRLGLVAAKEQSIFAREQQHLAELKPEDPTHQDQVVLLRLLLAREDPLRRIDAVDAVRAAAGHLGKWMGQDALLASMEKVDPLSRSQLRQLMAGQLPEEEENAAILGMQHARLS